jgi:hypothetical protein
MFSLAERSIFLTLAGSHAHGTARDNGHALLTREARNRDPHRL